jgi:hypothetical protein
MLLGLGVDDTGRAQHREGGLRGELRVYHIRDIWVLSFPPLLSPNFSHFSLRAPWEAPMSVLT